MGRRRGGEAILRNILNISRSRSKEEKRKGGKPGSLWCPYGKRDEDVEDDSNAGFYCRGDESNLTPSSSENPNSAGAVFEEKEKESNKPSLTVDPNTPVGHDYVRQVVMFYCDLCHKYLPKVSIWLQNLYYRARLEKSYN